MLLLLANQVPEPLKQYWLGSNQTAIKSNFVPYYKTIILGIVIENGAWQLQCVEKRFWHEGVISTKHCYQNVILVFRVKWRTLVSYENRDTMIKLRRSCTKVEPHDLRVDFVVKHNTFITNWFSNLEQLILNVWWHSRLPYSGLNTLRPGIKRHVLLFIFYFFFFFFFGGGGGGGGGTANIITAQPVIVYFTDPYMCHSPSMCWLALVQ